MQPIRKWYKNIIRHKNIEITTINIILYSVLFFETLFKKKKSNIR